MDKKYICCCSFGKDSIATVILAHENNEPLDEIVYSEVMFDENLSGERPEHRDFIYNIAIPTFEKWGYKVTVVRSEKHNYVEQFFRPVIRSKVASRNGKLRGFPLCKGCHMNSSCKVQPMKKYFRQLKDGYIEYVGIAIDEKQRLERVHNKGQISLLEKYNYTEQMALEKCVEYGLLSPIYNISKRNGCWFCPNMSISELENFISSYPDIWKRLEKLPQGDELANPYFNSYKKMTIDDINKMFVKQHFASD